MSLCKKCVGVKMELKKMSKKELIKHYKVYYGIIYINECYGLSDLRMLRMLSMIENEMDRRGYKVVQQIPEVV